METLRGRRVLVLGLGVSGRSAAAFCASRGASVVAADERTDADASGLPPEVEVRLGAPFPDPADFDLVVPSPGVPRARWAGARLALGDVELAFRALRIPVAAVTGTNGKSTTVRLLEAMLRAAGLRAEAAGNVGEPALGLVGRPLDVAVLEVSSFQLEAVDRFRPKVGVWLNATPDHLDRHGDFDGYVAAKARLFARQGPEDVAVLNAADPAVAARAAALVSRVWWFSAERPVERGAWWDGGALALRTDGPLRRFPLGEEAARIHPENLLAALLAAEALGADAGRALQALPRFRSLPHRLEVVAEAGGVAWVDDSKATNPGAAAAALHAQTRPVVWIAGGKDKGLAYESLASAARGRVRSALLIGETAEALGRALAGAVPAEAVGTLDAAVARAAELARPGDVVLLAPACASFDQFRDYADRGDRFRAAVQARIAGAAA